MDINYISEGIWINDDNQHLSTYRLRSNAGRTIIIEFGGCFSLE